ncbi:CHAT domain-containing protein [Dinghuibacter silviterrae]|uniref:CHAT domain-containing protein n=1 Tax=Dinghuibacter silviterrae TaxID=1539049 RepID=A0A4R8DIB2_9BACT|nr:CHAT domain-containing tetratricopeptide repeat protein [Dinghuibacter silviterrae]TDW97034.1 CHAT domain-containing protein [Dinghuibacter silviterrae]
MRPVKALTYCLLGCLLCLSGQGAFCQSTFDRASAYFATNHPTVLTDSLALALFDRVIREAHPGDNVLARSYLDKGILLDVKGRFGDALEAYRGAIASAGAGRSDTLLFQAFVYGGTDFYRLDDFDSAEAFLTRAEALDNPGLPERDRLYNALGALNYEGGNYLQGKDYFIKALDITRRERPGDMVSRSNFENNIASCLYKLKDYRGALTIYLGLTGSEQVYLNMGQCYREMGDYKSALAMYRRVRPRNLPGVYNEMANVYFLKGDEDSALTYLDTWRREARPTKVDEGINALYRAQVLMARRQHLEALGYLQDAIIAFSRTFRDQDIHANPSSFTGAFASYRLFDALSFKANTLESLYSQTGKGEYLEEALGAYNSAILLFRYIEKTYATDDAKLFLKRNNQDLYENAVMACLELDRLHPGGRYLEKAFITAEESKASIVSGRLEERALNHLPGMDPQLLRRQRELKRRIARLDLQDDLEHSSAAAGQRVNEEIELASVQRVIEQNSAYYKDDCPSVRELQAGLADKQAIVSFFASKEGLHIFTLTATAFHCLFVDSLATLTANVRAYLDLLGNTNQGNRFGDRTLTEALYHRLVKPLLDDLGDKEEWTIIPDGIFYRFPFEALPLDQPGHYLIDRVTIGYQLSTKFLDKAFHHSRAQNEPYNVLAFAPFADRGALTRTPASRYMNRLSGSGPETAHLPGARFINEHATKARFLEELPHYRVIHLATHAITDSLICFFPVDADPEDDCLFLPEIYGLGMDSTDLVILSACESGNGKIEGNEGLMSLSRAFMYAGCASTVNSLWKADDGSTALILKQFHVYLEKGLSKSEALRQAKLDYIHSNAVYVSPNYWAHLVLVGNTEAIVGGKSNAFGAWWWIAALVILCAGSIGLRRLFLSPSGKKDVPGLS